MSLHWNAIITAGAASVQAGALLVAGTFAYIKYVRGRVHYSSLAVSVEATVLDIDNRKCLAIATRISNSGTYRMVFNIHCEQRLAVEGLSRTEWGAGCSGPHLPWAHGTAVVWDQLVDNAGYRDLTQDMEPGETINRNWMIPAPPGDWIAYRVSFVVDSCKSMLKREDEPQTWDATTIVRAN